MIVQEVFSKINNLNQKIKANKKWLEHYKDCKNPIGATAQALDLIKRKIEISELEVSRLLNMEIKE